MWILSDKGFVSIVEDRDAADCLLVRARREDDLEGFLSPLRNATLPRPLYTPDADYAWRVSLPRPMVAEAVRAIAEEIDYPNFKDAVARRQGWSRSKLYHDVWTVLRRLQQKGWDEE